MNLNRELYNGVLIFLCIAFYFLMMEVFGLSNIIYLRMLNAVFVAYGVALTLQSNFKEDKTGYVTNLLSAGITALIGVLLSVLGLLAYIYAQGGDEYVESLSSEFLFGGSPTANEYAIGLLFEGIASSVIVVFVTMQFFRNKTAAQD